MKCPTKDQVLEAAKGSQDVGRALRRLFPEAFERPIQKGELYEWGTDSDGGSGLVVDMETHFSFVNFRTGELYIGHLDKATTKADLNWLLSTLQASILHNCYKGEIRGPKHFKSWCTK